MSSIGGLSVLALRVARTLSVWTACIGVLLLTGCAGVDTEQARLCRLAAVGLESSSARIEIISQTPLADGGGPGVRMLYRRYSPEPASPLRVADCRFAATPSGMTLPRNLTGLTFDGRRLGDIRRYLLIRHWLENPTSAAADPEPITGAARAIAVSPPFALLLQTVVASLPLISIYALLAAAYSLVYGLIGRINLAFGELAIGGAIAAYIGGVAGGQGEAPWLAISLAVALASWTAVVHGATMASAVLAPLARSSGQMVLVATLGLALALQEYFRLVQGAGVRWMRPLLDAPFALARAGDYVVALTPIAVLVTVVACVAAACVLAVMQFTRYGRRWRACADDPLAAALIGIDPRGTLVGTMAVAATLAGLAGCLTTLFYGGAGHSGGLVLGLKALIAAILGGIGSVPGAFVGGIVIGAAEATWSAFLPIEHRDLFIFLLLAVVLALRPPDRISLDNRERATRL
jgi:branched-chain amino acid transport system permease protein